MKWLVCILLCALFLHVIAAKCTRESNGRTTHHLPLVRKIDVTLVDVVVTQQGYWLNDRAQIVTLESIEPLLAAGMTKEALEKSAYKQGYPNTAIVDVLGVFRPPTTHEGDPTNQLIPTGPTVIGMRIGERPQLVYIPAVR